MKEKKPNPRKAQKSPAVFVHFGGAYAPLYKRLKKRAEREIRSLPALIRLILAAAKEEADE